MDARSLIIPRLSTRILPAAVLLAIVVIQIARIPLTLHRWICVDEFEHLHAAWCMAQGLVPYRDFFEHHTPLLYFLLAPILHFTKPESSYAAAIDSILLCRWIMYALGTLIVYLTYRLGREMHSKTAGLLAVLFALSSMMYLDRSMEIRPDMLSVPAMLAALILTLRTVRRGLEHPTALRNFTVIGVLIGLAILATPKSLFWLDGFGAALALHLAWPARRVTVARRIGIPLAMTIGAAVPLGITLAIFAVLHAAPQFIRDNFLLNAAWKFHLNPWDAIHDLAYENPPLAALGLAGLLYALVSPLLNRKFALSRRGSLFPALALAALIAGIFIIPVPYTEYFLMLIPLLGIYQAILLIDTFSVIAYKPARRPTAPVPKPISFRRRRATRNRPPILGRARVIPFALLGAAQLAFILIKLRVPYFTTSAEILAWFTAAILMLLALRFGHWQPALLLLVAVLCIFPAPRFIRLFDNLPRQQDEIRQSLAYIHQHTAPTDTIFDGWQHITAPFRPHAFAYFFLHREIRPMLPPAAYQSLFTGLTSGTIHPALVVMDEDTLALPPDIVAFFTSHYHPTEINYLWTRNTK